jgi:hypothetical protein
MSPHLLDLSDIDASRLLSHWSAFLPADATLIAVSCFGDLFLRSRDGSILWLDTLEGHLVTVAASEADWTRLLRDPDTIEQWFWPGYLESLENRGVSLGPGQRFAWSVHPLIGGPLEGKNLRPMDIIAYHAVVSKLHSLPAGTKISHFTIDGEIP